MGWGFRANLSASVIVDLCKKRLIRALCSIINFISVFLSKKTNRLLIQNHILFNFAGEIAIHEK